MTDPANDWIAPLGQMLDGLGIAMCLFDDQDRTQAWNETFLRFFPEHAGHVHVGEPYCDNLRRFYLGRLGPDENERIDSYIDAGIARHRGQTQPFAFEHRGRQLVVSSVQLQGGGDCACGACSMALRWTCWARAPGCRRMPGRCPRCWTACPWG